MAETLPAIVLVTSSSNGSVSNMLLAALAASLAAPGSPPTEYQLRPRPIRQTRVAQPTPRTVPLIMTAARSRHNNAPMMSGNTFGNAHAPLETARTRSRVQHHIRYPRGVPHPSKHSGVSGGGSSSAGTGGGSGGAGGSGGGYDVDIDGHAADAPLHDEYGALFGYSPEFFAGLLLPKRALCHQTFALAVASTLLHRTSRLRGCGRHMAVQAREGCARSRWAKAPRVRRRPLLVHRFRLASAGEQ